jgi:hypothetical protein
MRFESKRCQNEENVKKTHFAIRENVFFFLLLFFLAGPSILHFKDALESLRRCSYNILNHPVYIICVRILAENGGGNRNFMQPMRTLRRAKICSFWVLGGGQGEGGGNFCF